MESSVINNNEDIANEIYRLIKSKRNVKSKNKILLVCIGTDKSIGDSLGPLVGYKLESRDITNLEVIGTLKNPIHAMNMKKYIKLIEKEFKDYLIIVIDAAIGTTTPVGHICIGDGVISPGAGCGKILDSIGNISITGVVDRSIIGYNPDRLMTIRLSLVMGMADKIVEAVCVLDKMLSR